MTRTSLQLNDGQVVRNEAGRSDDPRILGLETAFPRQRWCLGAGSGDLAACAHCSATWQPGPGLVVTASSGQVVAAARICACENGEAHGHLTLTLAGPFEDTGLGLLLLREIREEANAAGFDRLYACLLYRQHDVIRDCQAAGFRIESVLSDGSISEVVLRVDEGRVPAATAAE
jgi:hypothetical protein